MKSSSDLTAEVSASVRTLVTIKRFRDLPDSLLAKGAPEPVGIDFFLVDENIIRMDWFISNLIGGVKLPVAPEDVEEANEILDLAIPPEFAVDGMEDFVQPACPKCGSLDMAFETINKPVALTTAWVIAPIPLPRDSWKCGDCGARWVEEPDAGGEPAKQD